MTKTRDESSPLPLMEAEVSGIIQTLRPKTRGLADRLADASDRGRSTHADAAVPSDPVLRPFMDAIGVAVYGTDASGRISFYNEAAAQLWGRRPALGEEWCGSWRLFAPDGTPMRHDECPMAVALKENRSVRGEEAIAERPDGTRVAFVPHPTPIRDVDGMLIGAVNVLVDVTDRVSVEKELRATAEALRASNAVKDEFLGLVSHELRTPVTTIFGNARLLEDRGDELALRDRQTMITDIAGESERLLGIVENLLQLLKLGATTELDIEPQLLTHVVRRSVDSFQKRHPQRTVAVRAEPRHVIVEGDRTYLDLVMENLLSNADKYSDPGEEIVAIVSVDEKEAQVVVLDRGIGIPAGAEGEVFTPFYRAEPAKVLANGLGIGLAVCRRVIEMQRGRIWAERRDGGGSEVGFALPLLAEA